MPATGLLFAVPVVAYFVFIAVYGVNTIYGDQWADVAVLQKLYSGHLTLGALWAAHNENRTFFPNLVMLVLARLTNLNVVVEMFVSAVLVLASSLLLILAHRRRAPATEPIWYVPVVVLMFILSQYYGTLLGYELAWYMSLLAVVLCVFILDRHSVGWLALAAAAATAVVGSCSSIEGFLAWAAGLLLLLVRQRWPMAVAWSAAAVATVIFYVHDLSVGPTAYTEFGLQHPAVGAQVFFVALGDTLGYGLPLTGASRTAVLLLEALGVMVFLAGSMAIGWSSLTAAGREGAGPVGAALTLVGLLFAGSIAVGRGLFGMLAASQSRFVTFDVLALVGAYLVWLAGREATRSGAVPTGRRAKRTLEVLVVLVALAPAGFGAYHGIEGGRSTRTISLDASDVVVNIARAPGWLVEGDLYPTEKPELLRALAEVARSHHLSLFATGQVVVYERRGLDVGLSFKVTAKS